MSENKNKLVFVSTNSEPKKVGGEVVKKVAIKRKLQRHKDVSTQTEESDDENLNDEALVTGDEPPRKYFRLLADEREKIIQKLINKNEDLQDKIDMLVQENIRLKDHIDILEQENVELESMTNDARKLAEYISNLPDDQDESGIERDPNDEDND